MHEFLQRHIDIARLFSQPGDKARMTRQRVTGESPTGIERRSVVNWPTSLAEAEARLFACDWLARLREPDPSIGCAWLDPAARRVFAARWLRATAELHPLNMAQLADLAIHGERVPH